MSIAGALVGGGMSILGGMVGAASQNRAARKARDWAGRQADIGKSILNRQLFDSRSGNLLRTMTSSPSRAARDAAQDEFNQTNPAILPGMRQLAAQQGAADQANLAAYDATTQRVTQGDADIEAMLRAETAAREGTIRRDIDRQFRGADRLNRARNAMLGVSSLGGNMTNAAARQAAEVQGDAINALRMGMIDRLAGQRNQQLNRIMARDADRTGLAERAAGRAYSAGMAPLSLQYQAASGPVNNPFAGNSGTQYFPGASPLGTGLVNAGNALGSASSFLLAQRMFSPQTPAQGANQRLPDYGFGPPN